MTTLVDYVTMTIKPDSRSTIPVSVSMDWILDFFNLPSDGFVDTGRKGFYEHCYTLNGIDIQQPYEDNEFSQGWCVRMSGDGCRYYASTQKDGEFLDFWREFFTRFRSLTSRGYAVNVSRIDIAVDDYDGLLNLDTIENAARERLFVSRFRSTDSIDVISRKRLSGDFLGRTLYFGSRTSSTFCRFYDKLEEQKQKHKNNVDELIRLSGVNHWVRMEFEFKKEQAMKIVNLICDSSDFSSDYAGVVNAYIRFVQCDDSNVTRQSVTSWWSSFLGTLKRIKLTVGEYKPFGFNRLKAYVTKYLSPTLSTLLSLMSVEEFLHLCSSGLGRLNKKQRAIIEGAQCDFDMSNSDLWELMHPLSKADRVAYEL